ncbi:FadR/GntR family transcriptional regulator [Mucilaginibacter terrae]|uniref:GntR family transcriptional repressor for pyruvate dehydrogenase complex n=1 Tax=Mucilaginibacter terrae TaxID=1955052 RepID=A0ABU3GRW2_9SPHI|nr:FadR/GntR family transcriptional regulator [Mucilaginibacter terrae]MDT3402216.1 GntR family transcriptional repressor for pyruvate dehydrogenase complex [Mucilaginibacter terrae]
MKPFNETLPALQPESSVDKIIRELKQLIVSGQLKPGDRLPAERQLSEKFGVGRSYVREAILKLEFYGLLKTNPQSGTYVSGLSIKVIDNIINDIIKLNKDNFSALIEARYYLELDAVKLAAERRTEADLEAIEQALLDYEAKTLANQDAVEEDMLFHIMIARAANNSVIESMILVLIPDLIKNIIENKVCGENRGITAMAEHRAILDALKAGDIDAAENAMAGHLDEILQISRTNYTAHKIINNQ